MLKILKVEAVVHSHATENEKKVIKALMEVFPQDVRNRLVMVREELSGHYNNPIIRITAETPNEEDALKTFEYILSRLSSADVGYIRSSLDERVDKNGVLHLRVSKQDAYLGRLVVLEGDDVIKISIHIEGRRRKVLQELERYLKDFSKASRG
jgi:RNA binding exosome subunit